MVSTSLSEEDSKFVLTLPIAQADLWGYPIHRRLTNADGRTLDTVINGRSQGHVYFRSLRDQRNYTFPIRKLSSRDRNLLTSLPVTN